MSYGVIYTVFCSQSGKFYVGQTTTDAMTRWKEHLHASRAGKGHVIGKAIAKYGPDSFKVETVDTAACKTDLDAREMAWIAALNSVSPHGYNIQSGGSRGRSSDETREKQRQSKLGRTLSFESREKISRANKGRKMTPEQVERSRLTHIGKKRPPRTLEHQEKLSAALRGKPKSDAHRENLRLAKLGTHRTPEAIEKTRQANLGRHHTEETKEKIRQAITGTVRTDEEKEKNRVSHLGKGKGIPQSPEHREKIRQAALLRWKSIQPNLEVPAIICEMMNEIPKKG